MWLNLHEFWWHTWNIYSWQYPLINYLCKDEESDENVINPLSDNNYQAESDYIINENIKEEDFRSDHVFTEQF